LLLHHCNQGAFDMAEDRIETTHGAAPHTTIIERRGSGGGLLIGLAVLVAVIVAAYFMLNQANNDNARTGAVTSAAKSVGDAADKAGDAVERATK